MQLIKQIQRDADEDDDTEEDEEDDDEEEDDKKMIFFLKCFQILRSKFYFFNGALKIQMLSLLQL